MPPYTYCTTYFHDTTSAYTTDTLTNKHHAGEQHTVTVLQQKCQSSPLGWAQNLIFHFK